MKKYMKFTAVMLIAILTIVSLVACSAGNSDEKDSGTNGTTIGTPNDSSTSDNASLVAGKTFVFESCTMDGEDTTEMILSMYKEQTIEFKDGGVCVQTIVFSDEFAENSEANEPSILNGTYEESDGKITAKFPATSEEEEDLINEFTVNADTLTQEQDGIVMVYKVK